MVEGEGQGWSSDIFLGGSPSYLFETESLTELTDCPNWLASKFQDSTGLLFPSTAVTGAHRHVWLFTLVLDSETQAVGDLIGSIFTGRATSLAPRHTPFCSSWYSMVCPGLPPWPPSHFAVLRVHTLLFS